MKPLFHLFFCRSDIHVFSTGKVKILILGPLNYTHEILIPPDTTYSIPTLISYVRTYPTLTRILPVAPSIYKANEFAKA